MRQQGGRGLAVGAGDAYLAGAGESAREFDFGHDADALVAQRPDHRGLLGDTGALDHLVGREDAPGGVAALFEVDAGGRQFVAVVGPQRPAVRQEDVVAFHLRQQSRAHAALAAAKYHKFSVHCLGSDFVWFSCFFG